MEDFGQHVERAASPLTRAVVEPAGDPTPVSAARELALLRLVADMVAGLSEDFDVIEVLTQVCDGLVDVIGIDACGVLLADGEAIEIAAVSGPDAQEVEFAQLQKGSGPCLDALRRGRPVVVEGVEGIRRAWPDFATACEDVGLRSVAAFPLPAPEGTMGTLNAFRRDGTGFAQHDLATCEAMARIVVLALVNARTVDHSRKMVGHLRHALESRVVIEQAKGIIARDRHIGMGAAFELLRGTARHRRVKLHDLAADIVAGTVEPTDLG